MSGKNKEGSDEKDYSVLADDSPTAQRSPPAIQSPAIQSPTAQRSPRAIQSSAIQSPTAHQPRNPTNDPIVDKASVVTSPDNTVDDPAAAEGVVANAIVCSPAVANTSAAAPGAVPGAPGAAPADLKDDSSISASFVFLFLCILHLCYLFLSIKKVQGYLKH